MDLYIILEVSRDMSCEEIEKVSKIKMLRLHPDKDGDFIFNIRE